MPCTKHHTKKYTSRNSPPYSAKDCKVGSSKKGNDGFMYTVSSSNVNGVKRWLNSGMLYQIVVFAIFHGRGIFWCCKGFKKWRINILDLLRGKHGVRIWMTRMMIS